MDDINDDGSDDLDDDDVANQTSATSKKKKMMMRSRSRQSSRTPSMKKQLVTQLKLEKMKTDEKEQEYVYIRQHLLDEFHAFYSDPKNQKDFNEFIEKRDKIVLRNFAPLCKKIICEDNPCYFMRSSETGQLIPVNPLSLFDKMIKHYSIYLFDVIGRHTPLEWKLNDGSKIDTTYCQFHFIKFASEYKLLPRLLESYENEYPSAKHRNRSKTPSAKSQDKKGKGRNTSNTTITTTTTTTTSTSVDLSQTSVSTSSTSSSTTTITPETAASHASVVNMRDNKNDQKDDKKKSYYLVRNQGKYQEAILFDMPQILKTPRFPSLALANHSSSSSNSGGGGDDNEGVRKKDNTNTRNSSSSSTSLEEDKTSMRAAHGQHNNYDPLSYPSKANTTLLCDTSASASASVPQINHAQDQKQQINPTTSTDHELFAMSFSTSPKSPLFVTSPAHVYKPLESHPQWRENCLKSSLQTSCYVKPLVWEKVNIDSRDCIPVYIEGDDKFYDPSMTMSSSSSSSMMTDIDSMYSSN